MNIIDSHTHLYLEDFKDDIHEVIDRAQKEGVSGFYLPAIDSSTIDAQFELEKKFPGLCFAMAGLHPCSVKENYKDELMIIASWLSKRKFAAIGEIGLDMYWDKTFIDQQYECFHKQIEIALQYDLPVVLHTRDAMDESIGVIQQYRSKGLKGIFHCFGGSLEQAQKIIDCSFLMGIGGVMTYKKSGLDTVLKDVPLENLVLETDAPYLTPVPFRGKRNEPSYLKYVIAKIAEIKNVSEEEVARVTTNNALATFKNHV